MKEHSHHLHLFLLSKSEQPSANWFKERLGDINTYYLDSPQVALAHAHLQADVFIVMLEEQLHLPHDFIRTFLALSPSTKFIFIGEVLPLARVTKIMRAGAWEYLDKNGDYLTELASILQTQFEEYQESEKDKNNLVEQFRQLGIIGNSSLSRRVYKKVFKAAKVDSSILILGESGVGKELIAQTIHKLSKRQEGPLIFVDCLSWPPELLEEELFGQEKNVFKGNLERKIGKIEASSGGSIVLNNAQALPLNIQEKLLRALQENKFIRPGGSNIVFFNARLMVVSSKDLERAMQNKEIRKDLYYQLIGYPIEIPPLRKRPSDIPILANFFLRQFLRRNKLKSLIFTQEAKEKLIQYSYPGNIRELKTIVEVSAINAAGAEINASDLSITKGQPFLLENWLEANLSLEEITYEAIQYYLKKNAGDVVQAAKELKIGKSTIYRILKSS
jgi:two-component system response regulator AtoC